MSKSAREFNSNPGTTIKLTETAKFKSGRYFGLGVAVSSLLLLLLCSLTALAQRPNRIPPCGPLTQYQPCTATVWQALGDAINSMEGANAARLAELEVRIEEARQRFFKAYPNGPGRAQAEEEFASLLLEKDMYLCNVDLFNSRQGQIDSSLQFRVGRNIDGGIRPFAIRSFNQWIELIRLKKGREMPNSLAELSNRFRKAFAESQPQYEQYRLARDWAEFAAAGRNITDDPKTYVTLLLAIKRPWGISGTFAETDLMEKAAEHYREMTEVFGEVSVLRAAKRLMAAPKNKDGNLAPVLQANGQRFETPYTAFKAMLGDGNPRNYILTAIVGEAWNEQAAGHLRDADKMYKYLVAAYGTKAVTDATEQVRRADKNEYDFIKDTKALGVQRNQPHLALEDLLSNKDPKGHVRAILAFHDNLTSAPEVDAAYARLISAHGEGAVMSAGEQLTAFWRAEHFPNLPQEYASLRADHVRRSILSSSSEGGAKSAPPSAPAGGKKRPSSRAGGGVGVYDLLMGLLDGSRTLPHAATNADLIVNPAYAAWKKFSPGTVVTYAKKSWWEQGGRIIPNPSNATTIYNYKLISVDEQEAIVEWSEQKFPSPVASAFVSQGRNPARVLKQNPSDSRMANLILSETSGEEILDVNGKMLRCRWHRTVYSDQIVKSQTHTIWTSDEVPGGLVRERNVSDGPGMVTETMLQPFQIDTHATIAQVPNVVFAVKSVSGQGPSQQVPPADQSNRLTTPIPLPKEQKPSEKQVGIISPQQEVGTYRANRLNAPAVNISVTFNNGKLLLTVPGQPTYLLENIGGRRYRLMVRGYNSFFVTFRPVKGDESKTEMFLEQPQGNFVAMKIQ